MPEHEIGKVKTKLRIACEKYCHVKVLHKQKKINSCLSVVIMLLNNYTEICLSLLSSNQFVHIANDPTKSLEPKVKQALQKIKSKLSEQEHKKVYPTGSVPGKFYGTAKIHKLSENGGTNDLPFRPIVSNLNTVTYNLAKDLSKLMSPILQSRNTVKNTK